MTDTSNAGTCVYTAEKEDPSNWHGDDPDEWLLDAEASVGPKQEKWTCPHDALSGEEHCAFHTDPDDVPDEIDEGELFVKTINETSVADDGEKSRQKKSSSARRSGRSILRRQHWILGTSIRFDSTTRGSHVV